jgi:hypothetical protein
MGVVFVLFSLGSGFALANAELKKGFEGSTVMNKQPFMRQVIRGGCRKFLAERHVIRRQTLIFIPEN